MELEEASGESIESAFYYDEDKSSTSRDPFSNINTRDIKLLTNKKNETMPIKKVQLQTQDDKELYSKYKYRKSDTIYRRYIENDEENMDDPEWSTTVQPFDNSQLEPETQLFDSEEPQLTTSIRLSFLEHFEDLPTIDEISSSLSEETFEPVEYVESDRSLLGTFVDPLTGLELEKSIHSMQMEYEYEYIFDEQEEGVEYQMDITTCENLDISDDSELLELEELDADLDKIEGTKMDQQEEDIENIEIVTKRARTEDVPFDEAVVEDTKRQCENIVATFVDDLIQLIVKTSEFKDPKEVLRQTINKRKLMDEITKKLSMLEVEQNMRLYLNRKVVEYHKRKKFYRAIIDDSPDTIDYFKAKYKEQLDRYDKVMGKEAELATVMNLKTEKLKTLLAEKQREVEEKIAEFEDIVKKTLLRGQEIIEGGPKSKKHSDGRPDFGKNICTLLNKFTAARKEISVARLALIKKQHSYAELKERLYHIENLGHGLNLSKYEQLLNEVKQLFKKNEEWNYELAKARNTRVIDVHINTHMKETVLMLRNALECKKLSYRTLLGEYDDARHYLYKQKNIRARIRKESKEYLFQGGILSKPALMLDYDRTAMEVSLKEYTNEVMRTQLGKITEKIAQYEQLLQTSSNNKFK